MTPSSLRDVIESLIKSWNKNVTINQALLNRQEEIASKIFNEAINLEKGGLLFILRAPTGSGKSEVFLAPYFWQWFRGEFFSPRMYLVEPLHAILRHFKDRVQRYVEGLGLKISIGEDHGETVKSTYLYGALITLTTVDAYVYGYAAKRVQVWETLGGAATGRYTMPTGLIVSALSVFDEAHLIQDEVFLAPRLISRIICYLVSSGAIVLLSSATLPTYLEELLARDKCGKSLQEVWKGPGRNIIIDTRKTRLQDSILQDLSCEKNNLVIVNTIERAQKIYKSVKEKCRESKVYLVHSLMRKEDRERSLESLKELKEEYEKSKNLREVRDGAKITLIGTQALEVGLDYDFDVLYTELAPIDSVIQRIGRVGRRGRKGEAIIYLDLEHHAPYHQKLIDESKDIIKGLPSMNLDDPNNISGLVDQVYKNTLIEELSDRGNILYIKFIEYIKDLHLLAYPPQRVFTLRPSFYIYLSLIRSSDVKKGDKGYTVDRDSVEKGLIKYSISMLRDYAFERLLNILKKIRDRDALYIVKDFIWDDRSGKESFKIEKVSSNNDQEISDAIYRRETFVIILDEIKDLYDPYLGLDYTSISTAEEKPVRREGTRRR
ncbi:MAG: CRISPR-associated helicase Cas3' [Sulfolobales archaeon]